MLRPQHAKRTDYVVLAKRHKLVVLLGCLVLLGGLFDGLASLRGGSNGNPALPAQIAPTPTVPTIATPVVPTTSESGDIPSALGETFSAPSFASSGMDPVMAAVAPIVAAALPSVVTSTTTTSTSSSTTTTTIPIEYAADVQPTIQQSPTNPLSVTYKYSAHASTEVDGVDVALNSLPAGTLTLAADGTQSCTMTVGREVTNGSCVVKYAAFGVHSVVATYATNGNTYESSTQTNQVNPYSTTVAASFGGGGSLGGLIAQAAVTDSNGNVVTVGSVSMTVSDVTQGWSYVVNGTIGENGGNQSAFACLFVENSPKVGEYQGCGFNGPIVVTPASGDVLTIVATYMGTTDWTSAKSTVASYSMPL